MEVDNVENDQFFIKKEEYANVFKKSATNKEQTRLINLLNNDHMWQKLFICKIRFFRGFRQLCNFIVAEDIHLSLSDNSNGSVYYVIEVSVLGEVLKLLNKPLNITAALKFPRTTKSCTKKLSEDRGVKSYILIVSDQPNAIDAKVFSSFYVNDTLIVKPIYETRIDVSFYFDFHTIPESVESLESTGPRDSSRKLCESTIDVGLQVDMLDVFKVIMKNADHQIEPNQMRRLLSANFNREVQQSQHVFVSSYNENVDISINLTAKRITVSAFDCKLVEEIVDYLRVHFK